MKNKQPFHRFPIFILLVIIMITIQLGAADSKKKSDAVSSATQLAVKRALPEQIYLYMGGEINQPYRYSREKLAQFPFVRIRTIEKNANGDILGAYIYTGIPVLYILEKTTPLKRGDVFFNRPLDMQVAFHSSTKNKVLFSYGELTMATDSNPVILAFHREPLRPSKAKKNYDKNKLKGELKGFRLICPGDGDNSRFLDDIRDISLTVPKYDNNLLPKVQKGAKLTSKTIVCIDKGTKKKATFKNIARRKTSNWVRIGHGRGIKGDRPASAGGFHLASFLKANFSNCGKDDFFLFVGSDGYRALFSGQEIFNTHAGNGFMLLDSFNGKPPKSGFVLGTISDFFIDRSIRGLSHILRIK